MKTEETKSISRFFSKKGVTCERETNPQVKRECEDPVITNQGKSVKEETETQESAGDHFREKISEDSNDDVSVVACGGERNFQVKRDYKEFSADAKPKISEDSKDDGFVVACGGERNLQVKRDYEEFSANAKPPDRKTDMPSTSPKKKKGGARGAGEKQATLFSYFGKG